MNVPIARDATTDTMSVRVPPVAGPPNLGIEWDAENRLLAVKQGTTTLASFTYDGTGRRASKTAGTVTTTYVYDGTDIGEERSSIGGTVRYFFGLGTDDVLARQDSTGAFYYVKDHLGSVRQKTNSSGDVVLSHDYDPWGNLLSGSSGATFSFTGREWDSEIELYYYRARYYSSGLGRFLSADPGGQIDGPNLYAYVGNNPATFTDPSGRLRLNPHFSIREDPSKSSWGWKGGSTSSKLDVNGECRGCSGGYFYVEFTVSWNVNITYAPGSSSDRNHELRHYIQGRNNLAEALAPLLKAERQSYRSKAECELAGTAAAQEFLKMWSRDKGQAAIDWYIFYYFFHL